mgnify:FL=1
MLNAALLLTYAPRTITPAGAPGNLGGAVVVTYAIAPMVVGGIVGGLVAGLKGAVVGAVASPVVVYAASRLVD